MPHEFGDFAILMKSGFSKWNAVKAQITTAFLAILGAVFALAAQSSNSYGLDTSWILPFSAGGFLYIAMSNILPDLLKEDNPLESVKQLFCITSGVALMALVNKIEKYNLFNFNWEYIFIYLHVKIWADLTKVKKESFASINFKVEAIKLAVEIILVQCF